MKKVIPIMIILGSLAAGVIFFRKCTTGAPAKDKQQSDSAYTAWLGEKKVTLLRDDSLQKVVAAQALKIDTLIREKIEQENDLSVRGKLIDNTIVSGQKARAVHDTAWIIENCDSLTKEVVAGKQAVGVYEVLTNDLVTDMNQQLQTKDSIASNWKGAFLHADTALAFQKAKYNSLYVDDTRKSMQLKIYKPAAALLLAATVLTIILKK